MDDKEKKDTENLVEKYLLSLDGDINSAEKFTVSMAVNDDGVVDIQLDWPEDAESEITCEKIAHLLYAINRGELKTTMVEAITEAAIKDPSLKNSVRMVVKKWLMFQQKYSSEPCVKPREALGQ